MEEKNFWKVICLNNKNNLPQQEKRETQKKNYRCFEEMQIFLTKQREKINRSPHIISALALSTPTHIFFAIEKKVHTFTKALKKRNMKEFMGEILLLAKITQTQFLSFQHWAHKHLRIRHSMCDWTSKFSVAASPKANGRSFNYIYISSNHQLSLT